VAQLQPKLVEGLREIADAAFADALTGRDIQTFDMILRNFERRRGQSKRH